MVTAAGTSLSPSASVGTLGSAGLKGAALLSRAKAASKSVGKIPIVGGVKDRLERKAKEEIKGVGSKAGNLVKDAVRGRSSGDAYGKGMTAVVESGAAGFGELELLEEREKQLRFRKGKPFDSVDITGFQLEDVMACKTGKKAVDKVS